MPDKPSANPKKHAPTMSFADVTRDIARRNDEAQKAARIKRAAREQEQIKEQRRRDLL